MKTVLYCFYAFLMGLFFVAVGYPTNWTFGLGMVCGAAFVGMYYDSMLGQENHRQNRSWSWRPYWKSPYSKTGKDHQL